MPKAKNKVPIISQRAKEHFDIIAKTDHKTQADLADYCRVTRQRINQILNGSGTCYVDQIVAKKLKRYLRVTLDYLSGYTDNPQAKVHSYKGLDRDTNTSYTERIELMLPFMQPDHVTRLQQRITNLTSFQQGALDTILDFLEQSNSPKECERVIKICSSLIENSEPPTFQNTQDYIYNDMRYNILPDLAAEILDILYTDKYSQALAATSFTDTEFITFLKQNLGDFKKETKQLFQSKLRRVLSVYKNLENTSSEKVLTTKPFLSLNKVIEITGEVLYWSKSKIERYLDENYPQSSFTIPGSLAETELRKDFQKYLEKRSKEYTESMIKDIEKYINKQKT